MLNSFYHPRPRFFCCLSFLSCSPSLSSSSHVAVPLPAFYPILDHAALVPISRLLLSFSVLSFPMIPYPFAPLPSSRFPPSLLLLNRDHPWSSPSLLSPLPLFFHSPLYAADHATAYRVIRRECGSGRRRVWTRTGAASSRTGAGADSR